MNNEEQVRRETIQLMVGFMNDKVYKGQEIDQSELAYTAALYFDLVLASKASIEEAIAEKESQAIKASAVALGCVDASNPTQVDLMGGARAVEQGTMYRGEK